MAWSKLSRQERGYGAAWQRLRKEILIRDHHLCQPCMAKGRPTQATEVDHIKPKAKGGTDEPRNLRAICKDCHRDKTIEDAGGKVRPAIGLDGWPVHEGGQ